MEYLEQQASLGLLEREDTPDPRDLMETRVPLETRVCQDLLELLVTKVMLGLLEQMEPMDHQDLQVLPETKESKEKREIRVTLDPKGSLGPQGNLEGLDPKAHRETQAIMVPLESKESLVQMATLEVLVDSVPVVRMVILEQLVFLEALV